jgi:hypothetical protein
MDPKLIIHIGANKTGSSAIQNCLRLNWPLLRDLEYLVPDRELGVSERVTGEHVFALQRFVNQSDTAGLQRAMSNLLKVSGKAKIVFSAENLSNEGNFGLFGKVLREVPCKVILYIRRQDDLLMSSWQQWQSKIETDLHAWIISALPRLGHWLQCIEAWEDSVGQGRVDAFYDVVEKFTSDYYMTKQNKKRLSLITPQQRERIIDYYAKENDAIRVKYFPGRHELFDAVDHSKYEYATQDELIRRQLGFLAAMIYSLAKKSDGSSKPG